MGRGTGGNGRGSRTSSISASSGSSSSWPPPGSIASFEDEASLIRDCRRVPIKFGGYAISSQNGRVHVRIEQEQYNLLKAYYVDLAVRRKAETLERMMSSIPFEPYAPVRGRSLTSSGR